MQNIMCQCTGNVIGFRIMLMLFLFFVLALHIFCLHSFA